LRDGRNSAANFACVEPAGDSHGGIRQHFGHLGERGLVVVAELVKDDDLAAPVRETAERMLAGHDDLRIARIIGK
jgi:hypothetical protein